MTKVAFYLCGGPEAGSFVIHDVDVDRYPTKCLSIGTKGGWYRSINTCSAMDHTLKVAEKTVFNDWLREYEARTETWRVKHPYQDERPPETI